MPSATIPRAITPQQAADALQGAARQRLQGDPARKRVADRPPRALAFATVRLSRDGNATTAHVHGSGLIINRIINEFGIARTVTTAINEAFGPGHAA